MFNIQKHFYLALQLEKTKTKHFMDNLLSKIKNYKLDFHGDGSTYFGILIINWLLTAVTFGFYYPWAKAKKLQYLYNETTLNNSSFQFHGTGKEMFKGFLKALFIKNTLKGEKLYNSCLRISHNCNM